MRSRTRTIHKTDKFIIRKCTRRSTGKDYYELSVNRDLGTWFSADLERVRDILDPTRNRAGRWGTTWKYSSRAQAEQALTHLLMAL